jgi:hypothetical protein
MKIRVSQVLAAGNFKTLPESGKRGAGLCSCSLFSAQGHEPRSAQHAQDVSCVAHGDGAATTGSTWANWKTSASRKAVVALSIM